MMAAGGRIDGAGGDGVDAVPGASVVMVKFLGRENRRSFDGR